MKNTPALSVLSLLLVAACSDDLPQYGDLGGGGAGGTAGSGGSAGSNKGGATNNGGGAGYYTAGQSGGGKGGSGGTDAGMGGEDTGGVGGAMGGAGGMTMGGMGGMTAGMGGMGGTGFPPAMTCSGYSPKFGVSGAYVSVQRVVQDDFTLEAWVRTNLNSPGGTNFFDGNGLLYADVGGPGNDFGTSILNNKFAFGIGNPDTTVVGKTTINTGDWVHVAATRNAVAGQIEVFVFGKSDGKAAAPNKASLDLPSVITIGGNTLDGRYFGGLIDEVRLWDYVRTPQELTTFMHTKLKGDEPGLVGYWSFDNPGESTTPDASSKHLDGAILGSMGWVDASVPVCDPYPEVGGTGGMGGTGGASGGTGGASGGTGGASGGSGGMGGTGGASGGSGGTGGADPALILGYSFDEGPATEIADFSGNGNTATVQESRVAHDTGTALRINEPFGFASLPSSGITDGLNDFTVAIWVNPSSLPTWSRIFDFGTGTDKYLMLTSAADGTGKPRFVIKNGATEQAVDSSVALATGDWQQLTVTQKGDTVTLYLDGVVVGSNAAVTLRASSFVGTQNWLGRSQYGDPRYQGDLDDFSLYSRALTDMEVASLAAGAGDTVDTTGLLVSYDFDEVSGLTLLDASGGNRDGRFGGYQWAARAGGLAAQSDGASGYLSLPDDVMAGVTDFTLAAWVFQNSKRDWAQIFDIGSGTDSYIALIANAGASQKLRFTIKNGNEEFIDGPALPTGEWHHVAVTRAGTTSTIYVDGVASGSGTITPVLPSGGASAKNWLGRSQWPDPLFDGSIDDVRIYSRVLTTDEIVALAQ